MEFLIAQLHAARGLSRFSCSVKHASDLSNSQRDQMWHVFEENMYDLYVPFQSLSRFTSYRRYNYGDKVTARPPSAGIPGRRRQNCLID